LSERLSTASTSPYFFVTPSKVTVDMFFLLRWLAPLWGHPAARGVYQWGKGLPPPVPLAAPLAKPFAEPLSSRGDSGS